MRTQEWTSRTREQDMSRLRALRENHAPTGVKQSEYEARWGEWNWGGGEESEKKGR